MQEHSCSCGHSGKFDLRRRGPNIGIYCPQCDERFIWKGRPWVPISELRKRGIDPKRLPEHKTEWDGQKEPCSVYGCDRPSDQTHHWAVKDIFGKDVADLWPTSPLCNAHHNEWHRKVTPRTFEKMCQIRAERR